MAVRVDVYTGSETVTCLSCGAAVVATASHVCRGADSEADD